MPPPPGVLSCNPTEQPMDAPVVGFAGITHLGMVSGIAIAALGLVLSDMTGKRA